jgi:plasmid stabilization system protein ParE
LARVELAPEVLDDFDRILLHLDRRDVPDPVRRIQEIIAAIQVLTHSPLIGRPTGADKRELVIGRGSRGYLALYRDVPKIDTVFILAVRLQSERGFERGA